MGGPYATGVGQQAPALPQANTLGQTWNDGRQPQYTVAMRSTARSALPPNNPTQFRSDPSASDFKKVGMYHLLSKVILRQELKFAPSSWKFRHQPGCSTGPFKFKFKFHPTPQPQCLQERWYVSSFVKSDPTPRTQVCSVQQEIPSPTRVPV
jgi:hypothetical protein